MDIEEFLPCGCIFQARVLSPGYFLDLAQATEKCYFAFLNCASPVSFFISRNIRMQTHPAKHVSHLTEMKDVTHLVPCNWSTLNRGPKAGE